MAKTEQVTRTNSVEARKPRTSKIRFTDDGNANSKAVVIDAMDMINNGYKRLLRITNGKASRSDKDGNKLEYTLSPMSESRIQYVEDKLAAIHASVFEQLRAGKRTSTAVEVMPD